VLTPEGNVLINRKDLDNTRLRKGLGKEVMLDGESYISLRSIEDLDFAINEEEVSLEVVAAPHLFKEQTIDISFERPYEVTYTKDNSAFLNYALLFDSDNTSLNLSSEVGARLGQYLGISTFNYLRTPDEERGVRLLTFLRTDDRETLRTLTFGDQTAASGLLGTSLVLGGIGITKNFSVDPYFIRFPSLSLSGALETPSDVEVYVNDLLVRKDRLLPGEFDLKNVPASIGLGTADIVIKDVFGMERVISRKFFYSDRLLKRGLHEYSFGLGFVREDLGQRSFNYGKPALLAFHNYGFSEKLKGGYALEASKELINIGPTASFLVSKAGVVDGAFSFSNSDGKGGLGGFFGYFFRSRLINAALSVRSLSKDFSNLALKPSDDKPSFELTGVIGLNMKRHGSVSAEYSTQRLHIGSDTSRYALSYNRVITKRATFFITVSRTEPDVGDAEDEVFLSLHIYFGRDISGSLTHTERDGDSITTATVRKNLPVGTGTGFRAQAIR
jgi:outer membrane usher protein FimD/PapC